MGCPRLEPSEILGSSAPTAVSHGVTQVQASGQISQGHHHQVSDSLRNTERLHHLSLSIIKNHVFLKNGVKTPTVVPGITIF
jgi:hypothetical protein